MPNIHTFTSTRVLGRFVFVIYKHDYLIIIIICVQHHFLHGFIFEVEVLL